MNNKFILLALMLLSTLVIAKNPKIQTASSALEFQQTTNSRIVVEENFLRFFTGAEERIIVDANGNVGVGTSNPNLWFGGKVLEFYNSRPVIKLNSSDELSTVAFSNSAINSATHIGEFHLNHFYSQADPNKSHLSIYSYPGNYGLSVRADGNVGIGTSNPQYAKVQIKGGATHELLAINRPDSDVPALYLGNDGTNRAAIASNNADLTFGRDYAGTYSEYIRLQNGTGNVGIGTTDPGNYRLNVAGQMKATGLIDVGLDRPSEASIEGVFVKGVDGNGYASINLATKSWSGTHGIIFNAYKSASQVPGGISSTGNTKFTHDVGAYSGGAGMIQFVGNGGVMQFLVSQTSTGAGTDVNWGTPKMMIQRDGTIGVNTSDPDENYKLHVAGGIRATNFKSDANSYADFVFEDDYRLAPLSEVEEFIEKNNHLPDIPSEAEAKANGIDLQEMQAKLLQKIEELTLYVIELKKENQTQQKEIQELKKK